MTGAAGGLGRELRGRLGRYCDVLRLSDIANVYQGGVFVRTGHFE